MAQATHFTQVASSYEANSKKGVWGYCKRSEVSNVLDLLKKFKPQHVLDIGSGPGIYAQHIKNVFPSCEIICVDQSPAMVELCHDKGLQAFVADGASLSLSGNVFDTVLLLGVLEFSDKPENWIQNAKVHLSKNGRIFILIPRYTIFAFIYFLYHRIRGNPLHLRTLRNYKHLLKQQSLAITHNAANNPLSRLLVIERHDGK